MFLLVESGDKDSEQEESGEGMFMTNTYLAKHKKLLNSLPKNSIQDTGILAQLFHPLDIYIYIYIYCATVIICEHVTGR